MITQKEWELISRQASQVYNQLELEIIQEIAERISNVGYANTVVYNDVMIAQEMGILYQDVVSLVASNSNKSEQDIINIFKEAGIKSIKYDDDIYRKAGLKPIPIKQSESMLQLLLSTAKKTNNNLSNLCMTTASTTQFSFVNAMNKAYMEVSTGVKSYSSAIIDSIKELSQNGVVVEYPSGYKTSIENAVRMNIITGVNQTCGKLQEMRADELGWDLMELTAHSGARPEHAEWQGKIVSRSGKKGYLSYKDIGYGEPTGFKGVNCRHDWRPYFEGSARTYTDEELEEFKNETVVYNDKKISKYEATQIQRRMERQIRQDKKDIAGLNGILKNATDNKLIEEGKTEFAKKSLTYKSHQNILDDFIKQTQFRKDNARLYTGTQDKNISSQISNVTKIANKYNNSDIIGSKVNGVEIKEIGEHIISRTYARNLKFEDVEDCLNNPLDCGKIKIDEKGRKSFLIYGKEVTISINPETGKLINARKTNKRELKKYGAKK